MTSKMDVNGDTASLKRKREPKDDPKLSQKKHRRKSKLQENATGEEATSDGALQNTNGDLELSNTTSQALAGPERERLASWKLSKPMGGRMLDIDPVFSPDERLVGTAAHG
jgi:NET1-associated nuclear protein 1 (U3 small nucleolar RNA-associated protein 17)